MQVLYDFKRWHWIAIGLLLGLALGGIRVFWGPKHLHSTARTMSQEQFEGALLRPSAALQVSDLVVHPPDEDGNWWVTGRYVDRKSLPSPDGDSAPRVQVKVTGPFKYRAAAAYKPKLWLQGMSGAETNIRTYLDMIAARLPVGQVTYKYAWHERTWVMMTMWTGGTLIVMGGLWPTLLSILMGAGLGPQRKQREPVYDLARFKHEPEKPALVAAKGDQEQEKLAAFTAEMERKVVPGELETAPVTVDESPQPQVPVRQLTGQALEEVERGPEEEKEYSGEFYPTTAHAPHKET